MGGLFKQGAARGLLVLATVLVATASHAASGERLAYGGPANQLLDNRYITVGEKTRAPIGWVDFCIRYKPECDTTASLPRDIVLTPRAWSDMTKVNTWVNDNIKPMTDLDHWGVVEQWDYPSDGYGDCEDYVLLKRRMLTRAGWPREALLITVVRDKKNEGHAVLTVKTDKGEFIMDNQTQEVLPWFKTGYRFVKRQSQSDPNTWVALGEPREPATVSAN